MADVVRPVREDVTPTFIYLLIVTTIGPLLFGYHLVCAPPDNASLTAQAELNAPQEVLTCRTTTFSPTAFMSPLPRCIPMTEFQIGLVSSIFTVGGLLGALVAGQAVYKVWPAQGHALHNCCVYTRASCRSFGCAGLAHGSWPLHIWTWCWIRSRRRTHLHL